MQGSSAVMEKVAAHGFIHFLFTKILLPTVPIELEWQHLKKDQLSGQIFDDEFNECLCGH
jgi:putative transposase